MILGDASAANPGVLFATVLAFSCGLTMSVLGLRRWWWWERLICLRPIDRRRERRFRHPKDEIPVRVDTGRDTAVWWLPIWGGGVPSLTRVLLRYAGYLPQFTALGWDPKVWWCGRCRRCIVGSCRAVGGGSACPCRIILGWGSHGGGFFLCLAAFWVEIGIKLSLSLIQEGEIELKNDCLAPHNSYIISRHRFAFNQNHVRIAVW